MKTITLGSTGITTPQNAFGALPIQRVNMEGAVEILQKAWQGGMTFFDTALKNGIHKVFRTGAPWITLY